MIHLTPKPGIELLIVEVPAIAYGFEVEPENLLYYNVAHDASHDIPLPPGSWTFIATTDTLTEEAAKRLVAPQFDGYADYRSWDGNYPNFFTNPKNSFRSLVQSAGGDSGICYAILLKQTT